MLDSEIGFAVECGHENENSIAGEEGWDQDIGGG